MAAFLGRTYGKRGYNFLGVLGYILSATVAVIRSIVKHAEAINSLLWWKITYSLLVYHALVGVCI